jgi:cobalt/nickel transport system permease protein
MRQHSPFPFSKKFALYYAVLLGWLATTGMHIPDGYLSPATCLVLFLLLLPFWLTGIRKMRQTLSSKSVPLVALLAAFSFVIMMFNVPLPGGTSGHAVGAALAAIILGPEVATIAVSIALIIQAVFFGDGGILAIGANCFNMAVVIPYTAYALYRLIAGKSPVSSSRRVIGAAAGGWLGVTLGAFFTGLEFGLQPLLFHAADGSPLYAPYPLSVAIPAMVLPHMVVASVVEGLLTAMVVAYLQRSNASILEGSAEATTQSGGKTQTVWAWVILGLLALLTPLGLLAPGTAWGEWGTEELAKMGVQVPQGLQSMSGLWGAPLGGYDLSALGNANLGYVLSAAIGILLIGLVVWLFSLFFSQRGGTRRTSHALEHTLRGISETLERTFFAEEISLRPGFFQSLDPRVKLVIVLALLIGIGLAHNLAVILAIYALTLLLAWRSAVPLRGFIQRVWLFLPFLTGMIILPALFITPGPALLHLPLGIVVTQTGATSALFLLLRVSASVSLTLLLILTTPWNTLLSALGSLGVPDVFVLILGMTYRYIYLLLRTANDMFLSRQSRVVGQLSGAEERRMLAAASGTLLSKSLSLSSDVYLAMQSRGFRGKIVTLKPFRAQTRDWAWMGAFLCLAALSIGLGR